MLAFSFSAFGREKGLALSVGFRPLPKDLSLIVSVLSFLSRSATGTESAGSSGLTPAGASEGRAERRRLYSLQVVVPKWAIISARPRLHQNTHSGSITDSQRVQHPLGTRTLHSFIIDHSGRVDDGEFESSTFKRQQRLDFGNSTRESPWNRDSEPWTSEQLSADLLSAFASPISSHPIIPHPDQDQNQSPKTKTVPDSTPFPLLQSTQLTFPSFSLSPPPPPPPPLHLSYLPRLYSRPFLLSSFSSLFCNRSGSSPSIVLSPSLPSSSSLLPLDRPPRLSSFASRRLDPPLSAYRNRLRREHFPPLQRVDFVVRFR